MINFQFYKQNLEIISRNIKHNSEREGALVLIDSDQFFKKFEI